MQQRIWNWCSQLFRSSRPKPSAEQVAKAVRENAERMERAARDNALVYCAVKVGRASLARGDKYGAVMDTVRLLQRHGYDPFWLMPAAFEATMNAATEADKFVNGFACDEEAAKKWLDEHDTVFV